MTDPSADRPKNREVENENLKPAGEGRPPRAATDPQGAKPASGERDDSGAGPKSLRDTPKVG